MMLEWDPTVHKSIKNEEERFALQDKQVALTRKSTYLKNEQEIKPVGTFFLPKSFTAGVKQTCASLGQEKH